MATPVHGTQSSTANASSPPGSSSAAEDAGAIRIFIGAHDVTRENHESISELHVEARQGETLTLHTGKREEVMLRAVSPHERGIWLHALRLNVNNPATT